MSRRDDLATRDHAGNSDCFICHGLGKVLDRRETRLTGFNIYVECTCTGLIRGWERILASDRMLRDQALEKFSRTQGNDA